jgi:hypothetical protein
MDVTQTECEKCGKDTDDDKMLLCDKCDKGYHLFCLNPPMESIPDGDWVSTFEIFVGVMMLKVSKVLQFGMRGGVEKRC